MKKCNEKFYIYISMKIHWMIIIIVREIIVMIMIIIIITVTVPTKEHLGFSCE